MKVTVERAALLKSLGHVHRVVERRNTIPILANVLIKAEKSKLTFKATDLDVEVTESISAEVGPSGSTTRWTWPSDFNSAARSTVTFIFPSARSRGRVPRG